MFSLEMSEMELVQRMLAAEGASTPTACAPGAAGRGLAEAVPGHGQAAEAPLFIDDTPGLNMMEMRSKCRRLKQKHGLELVIVDYLQLMQSHRRAENRVQEVRSSRRGMKILAKELDVPVIALSQLSRERTARGAHRSAPQLSDLRESRLPSSRTPTSSRSSTATRSTTPTPSKGEAELIVAKHRNGGRCGPSGSRSSATTPGSRTWHAVPARMTRPQRQRTSRGDARERRGDRDEAVVVRTPASVRPAVGPGGAVARKPA
jgi:replicative DNA helicase